MNEKEKFNLILTEIQIYFKYLNKGCYEVGIDLEEHPILIKINHKAYLNFVNDLRKRYLNKPPIGENKTDIQKKFMFKEEKNDT
jgi:hypothetical protein